MAINNTWEQRKQTAAQVRNTVLPMVAWELNQQDKGHNWTYTPSDGDGWQLGKFKAKTGEQFSVGIHDGNKLTIYSSYGQNLDGRTWIPRDYMRDADDPQPSMSATKTDKQIAADIVRRFLPQYRINLAAYREHISKQNACKSNVDALSALMTKESNGRFIFSDNHRQSMSERITSFYDDHEWGSITVHDNSVRFEISCGPDLAVKIAKLMQK